MSGLERVPAKGEEGVRGGEVGDLDFLGHSVTAGDASVARAERRVVNTLALGATEGVAGEPVVAPARLSCRAVRTVATVLPGNIGAVEGAGLEAVLGSLLLGVGWDVSGSQELVDEGLVLADTPTEHAAMVSVVINAPLHIDDLARRVGDNGRVSPVGGWRVVVNADTGIVAARTTPADWCSGKIWPRRNGFENVAFGTSIDAGLGLGKSATGPYFDGQPKMLGNNRVRTSAPRRLRLDGMTI